MNQSLEANPDRADYRSKLLDTYFATKDAAKFSAEAETLKSMGSAADPYWSRVQAMGYEIAPDNALFSGGKDSDISVVDIGISKPEAADFDLGANEDDTNFSSTDFNLGEESGDFTDTQNFVETVVREEPEAIEESHELPDLDELPGLGEVAESVTPQEAEEELGELEFAFDAEEDAPQEADDDGAMDFELPEDMDLGAEDSDSATVFDDASIDLDVDDSLSFDADSLTGEEENIEATALVDMVDDFDATAFEVSSDDDLEALGDIDLGMDDTSLDDIEVDEDDGMEPTAFSGDLDDDIDTTALSGAIDEDLGVSDDEFSLDLDDEVAMMDIDLDSEPAKTDTFAPGDFDDPDELLAAEADITDIGNIDDLDDFMLPDDVDEVGTKLDLARAFIDMGDTEGARSSLDEVLSEGNEEQKAEATDIIRHL